MGMHLDSDVASMHSILVNTHEGNTMVSVEGYTVSEMLIFVYATYLLWVVYIIPLLVRTWADGKKYIGLAVSCVSIIFLLMMNQAPFRLGTYAVADGMLLAGILYEIWWLIDGSRGNESEMEENAAWRY